jgi:hypothetical protein
MYAQTHLAPHHTHTGAKAVNKEIADICSNNGVSSIVGISEGKALDDGLYIEIKKIFFILLLVLLFFIHSFYCVYCVCHLITN